MLEPILKSLSILFLSSSGSSMQQGDLHCLILLLVFMGRETLAGPSASENQALY